MSIVLNEYEWAENAIKNREMGNKPFETLNRVAGYYLENKYSKAETRKMLDIFLSRCSPSAPIAQWSDTLDRAVKSAGKFPLRRIEGVDITHGELEKIKTLRGTQARRLAFTLLCAAKYWDTVNEANNHWVNSPDNEIMQMANINTSIKRQSLIFSELRDAGLIRFAKKIDSLNVQVLFTEPGETAIHIRDFRNLGYQYLKHYGAPYFECESCGITAKMQEPGKGRRQKYCPSCAAEVKIKQSIASVMRCRQGMKN